LLAWSGTHLAFWQTDESRPKRIAVPLLFVLIMLSLDLFYQARTSRAQEVGTKTANSHPSGSLNRTPFEGFLPRTQDRTEITTPDPSGSETLDSSRFSGLSEMAELRSRLEALEKELEVQRQANSTELKPKNTIADSEKALHATRKPESEKPENSAEAPKSPKKKQETVPPSIPSDRWDVKLGGHIQLDYITWADADPAIIGAENYFSYRRLRIVADGVGYDQFDFRLQMTLEPGDGLTASLQATPDVKDAYVSINAVPGLGRVRVGNFFVPFSLEQVTNDTNNIFNERSIPTQGIFSPDREVGMAVYNHNFDQSVSWASGLFFDSLSDTIKTRFGDRQGYRLSGRLNWVPLYHESSEKELNGRYVIHTGLGILQTDSHNDQIRFRARPQVQRGPVLIDSGTLAASTNTTGGMELAVVWGPITIQNEAFLSQVNQLTGQALHVGGAYSHLSWFLTGENRNYERFGQHGAQFGRNKPYRKLSLRPGCWGWGALEAKARWSYLDLSDANAGQYNDFSSGLNWYWSDRTRVMFDWIHPFTTDETVFGSTSSDLLALRFDVNW
jgi:phosphate-selective porin OprO/OprP